MKNEQVAQVENLASQGKHDEAKQLLWQFFCDLPEAMNVPTARSLVPGIPIQTLYAACLTGNLKAIRQVGYPTSTPGKTRRGGWVVTRDALYNYVWKRLSREESNRSRFGARRPKSMAA